MQKKTVSRATAGYARKPAKNQNYLEKGKNNPYYIQKFRNLADVTIVCGSNMSIEIR